MGYAWHHNSDLNPTPKYYRNLFLCSDAAAWHDEHTTVVFGRVGVVVCGPQAPPHAFPSVVLQEAHLPC